MWRPLTNHSELVVFQLHLFYLNCQILDLLQIPVADILIVCAHIIYAGDFLLLACTFDASLNAHDQEVWCEFII